MKEFVVGGLYEYIRKDNLDKSELRWVYHDDNEHVTVEDQFYTYPKTETYVVLDVKRSSYHTLLSVKVLSSAGTIGRLHINPSDWKRLTPNEI